MTDQHRMRYYLTGQGKREPRRPMCLYMLLFEPFWVEIEIEIVNESIVRSTIDGEIEIRPQTVMKPTVVHIHFISHFYF